MLSLPRTARLRDRDRTCTERLWNSPDRFPFACLSIGNTPLGRKSFKEKCVKWISRALGPWLREKRKRLTVSGPDGGKVPTVQRDDGFRIQSLGESDNGCI